VPPTLKSWLRHCQCTTEMEKYCKT